MVNTIMSAKNSFLKGLIMDFNPSDTQADCLTSALNATLITFNGNEMALLNDMGNGRVETAYLPEGFMPVGTCEFGDIIYIVSYNPITKLSLIGCFPSPERNLSSEELGDLVAILSDSDFRDNEGNELATLSTKKVLISKKINPGDKYIVAGDNINNEHSNDDYIKNNEHINNEHVKSISGKDNPYIKLSIVSIEDSGKITYLNNDTKNYPIKNWGQMTKKDNGFVDIDSYRNLLQSGWDIFSSKVSGKLAILAELIVPETFSCTHLIDIEEEDGSQYYVVYLLPDCGNFKCTDTLICISDINPENSNFTIDDKWISEDGVYKIPLKKEVLEEEALEEEGIRLGRINVEDNSLVYNFKVSPARPFGRIDSLEVPLSIDFSKIGSGEINLTHWKYHNSETTITLLYGIETYLRSKETIDSVTIDFYDNNGLVGKYTNSGRKSYNGIITDYIGLDGNTANSRFSKYIKNNDGKLALIIHKGAYADSIEDAIKDLEPYIEEGNDSENIGKSLTTEENGNEKYHYNDSGILYSNFLYLAKITVNISGKKPRNEIFYRWLWTNNMFNQYFYNLDDFKTLKCELVLDNKAVFESNSNYVWKEKQIDNLNNDISVGKWNTYSANVLYIGDSPGANINMYIDAGLENNYGCFSIPKKCIKDIKVKVDLSVEGEINHSNEASFDFSYEDTTVSLDTFLNVEQNIEMQNNASFDFEYVNDSKNFNSEILRDGILDQFELLINGTLNELNLEECYYVYLDENGNIIKNNNPVAATLKAIIYNKAYAEDPILSSNTVPVYSPIINSIQDAEALGIYGCGMDNETKIKLGLNAINLEMHPQSDEMWGHHFHKNEYLEFDKAEIKVNEDEYEITGINSGKMDLSNESLFIEKIWNNINYDLGLFFLIYFIGFGELDSVGTTTISGVTPLKSSWKDLIRKGSFYNMGDTNQNKYLSSMLMAVSNIDGKGEYPNMFEKGNFSQIYTNKSYSPAALLGIRYDNGMSALNNAYSDSGNDDKNKILLKESHSYTGEKYDPYTFFCNFASLLYLLFTKVYHKNKYEEDKLVNMKNFVRTSGYNTTLTKHIVTTIGFNNKKIPDVLLQGILLSEFQNTVINNSISDETIRESVDKSNVTVSYLSSAKDNVLTVDIKNKPFEFPDIEKQAIFLYNGIEYLCLELSDNRFYIMEDFKLLPYRDREIIYAEKEIADSLKHIYNVENNTLYGLKPAKIKTNKKEAYEYLTLKFNEWVGDVADAISEILYDYNDYNIDLDRYAGLITYYYFDDLFKDVLGNIDEGFRNEIALVLYNYDTNNYFSISGQFAWGGSILSYIKELLNIIITYEIFKEGKIFLKDDYGYPVDVVVPSFSKYRDEIISYVKLLYQYNMNNIESLILQNDSFGCNIYWLNQGYSPSNQIGFSLYNNSYINRSHNLSWDVYEDGMYDTKISFTPLMNLSENFKYDGELSISTSKNHPKFGIIQDPGGWGLNVNRGIYGFMKDLSIDTTYSLL